MARRPRIHYAGALYHVILRGNAGERVFSDDVDRTKFCLLVQEGIERFGHRVHAFCLMSTHVHLAMQVGERALSRIMQNLTFRYTQWYNRRHGRIGHLFHGRYKANVVDVDTYLSALVRYIHLNPVCAGMVDRPEEYGWSSHRFYMGEGEVPWLERGFVLRQFGEDEREAVREFGRFVAGGMGTEEEEFSVGLSDGRVIGDDEFVARIQEAAATRKPSMVTLGEIIAGVCQVYGLREEELAAGGKNWQRSEARAVLALVVQEHPEIRLSEAAARVGRDPSSLAAGAARLRARIDSDESLRHRLSEVRGVLDPADAVRDGVPPE